MTEGYARGIYAAPEPSYPYISSQQEQTAEGAPPPLDRQMSILLGALMELTQLVDRLDPSSALKTTHPDKPSPPEGLTALVAACQYEASNLGMALRSIAERIGRL